MPLLAIIQSDPKVPFTFPTIISFYGLRILKVLLQWQTFFEYYSELVGNGH